MVGWILNVAYFGLILLVSPVLLWRRCRQGKYADGWAEKLWGRLPENTSAAPLIWIHAVSVGEVLLLRPLVSRLQAARPECRLLITTTTLTGYRVLGDKFPQCQRAYFPLDFTWAVKNALDRVRPQMVILAELEMWPNFLRVLSRRNIPTLLVNARLGEKSFKGYRRLAWLFRPALSTLHAVAVQTSEYAGRFLTLGVPQGRLHVTGSIKFDGVQCRRDNPATRTLRSLFALPEDVPVWVAGSTQAPEEQIVLQVFENLKRRFPKLRLVLVPRHPERAAELTRMIRDRGHHVWRRSLATGGQGSQPAFLDAEPILMLDTVGELGACWGLADVAYVGGSLGSRGGQNMIEPAAYGAAVCFGPNTWNFRHVVDMLLNADAAKVVSDEGELEQFVAEMLASPNQARALGERARELVLKQSGAAERTVDLILESLPVAAPAHCRAA